MTFNKWLDTFVEEKGLDTEKRWEIEGPSGTNSIPLGVVIEHCKITSKDEQRKIKDIGLQHSGPGRKASSSA